MLPNDYHAHPTTRVPGPTALESRGRGLARMGQALHHVVSGISKRALPISDPRSLAVEGWRWARRRFKERCAALHKARGPAPPQKALNAIPRLLLEVGRRVPRVPEDHDQVLLAEELLEVADGTPERATATVTANA